MTQSTPPQTSLPKTASTPQALADWQLLLQQTIIQSHLGSIMLLPRWAEVSQPWKAF